MITQNQGNIFDFLKEKYYLCIRFNQTIQVYDKKLLRSQTCRPVRAKALKYQTINKAFALTGRLADCYYTQGDALG